MAFVQDLTQEKKAAADLARNEARYRSLVEATTQSVCFFDTSGVICTSSDMGPFGCGFPFTQASCRVEMHPQDRARVAQGWQEAFKEGTTYSDEYRVRAGRGGWRHLAARAVPMRDEDGHIYEWVGACNDITEIKRAESALRDSEQKHRELVENINDVLFTLDAAGHIIYISPVVERQFGWKSAEMAGHHFSNLIYQEDLPGLATSFASLLEGRQERSEYRVVTKSGELRWVNSSSKVIAIEGRIVGVRGVITDITERKRAEAELQASEERYRAFISQSSEAIWRFECEVPIPVTLTEDKQIALFYRHGYLAECNKVMAQMYGYAAPEEIVGTRLENLLPPAVPENIAYLRNFIRSGYRLSDAESHEFDRDGNSKFFLNNLIGIVENGCLLRAWGTQRDITATRQAQILLKESEQRLEQAIWGAGLGLWDYNLKTGTSYTNKLWAELLGYTPEEVQEQENEIIHNLIHPDDLPYCMENYRAHLEGRTPFIQFDCRVRHKSGEWRWHLVNGKVVERTREGLPLRVIGTNRDITERKRNEESLRVTYDTLQAVVQSSPLAIATIDRDGHIGLWNPASERIFGWHAEEVLNRPIAVVPPELQAESWAMRQRVLDGERFTAYETQRITKDGQRIDVTISAAPLRNAAGEVANILTIGADVTERKRAEQILREREEQLRQAQKMEAVGKLAGGVAHDFNNLLTVITGYAGLGLMRLSPRDPLYANLEAINKAAARAADLTHQLLAFSRKQVLQPKLLNLNEIVLQAGKLLARLIGEDLELETTLAADLWAIKADPSQLEQVLINLAVNARDAMRVGGRLTIHTANVFLSPEEASALTELAAGHYVQLRVTDTGCGMDEDTLAHIFEPFFTTKEKGKGTGLGLATVYGIIKQSGGHITAASRVGAGTAFNVYLPRAEGNAEIVGVEVTSPALPSGTETILLVEDDDGVRRLAVGLLRQCGYRVLEAANAGEALLICEQNAQRVDLLLTDVVMPRMSGRELVERLQQIRPALRVIYMSGYTDDAIVRHGVFEQGVPFLSKPFTPAALARSVRDALDEPAQAER